MPTSRPPWSSLTAERTRVIAEVERQRLETITTMELLVDKGIQDATERADGILDRVLWKIGLMGAVAFVGAAMLLLLARALWRPRR